jgi:hypothetical protein
MIALMGLAVVVAEEATTLDKDWYWVWLYVVGSRRMKAMKTTMVYWMMGG